MYFDNLHKIRYNINIAIRSLIKNYKTVEQKEKRHEQNWMETCTDGKEKWTF